MRKAIAEQMEMSSAFRKQRKMNVKKEKTVIELKRQRAQIDARILALHNKHLAVEKKRDIRRRLLAGAYLLRLLKGDLNQLRKKLAEASMLSERDRSLFEEAAEQDTRLTPRSL